MEMNRAEQMESYQVSVNNKQRPTAEIQEQEQGARMADKMQVSRFFFRAMVPRAWHAHLCACVPE